MSSHVLGRQRRVVTIALAVAIAMLLAWRVLVVGIDARSERARQETEPDVRGNSVADTQYRERP
jgi:uncharacterized membrane protein SpoIIM required for sporulation